MVLDTIISYAKTTPTRKTKHTYPAVVSLSSLPIADQKPTRNRWKQLILDLLNTGLGFTFNELARGLGSENHIVRQLLEELEVEGSLLYLDDSDGYERYYLVKY